MLSFEDKYKMTTNKFVIRDLKSKYLYSNLLVYNRIAQPSIVGTRNGMTHTM